MGGATIRASVGSAGRARKHPTRRRAIFLLLLLGLLVAPLGAPLPARAATIEVTTLADSGPGSLRGAIMAAAAGDTIGFAAGLTGTILLTSGELAINKSLTITGPGAGALTISGNNTSRILNITAGTVAISGLTVAHGRGPASPLYYGGGVRITGGTVNFTDMVIAENTARVVGGGIHIGGGTVILTRTTVRDNVADSQEERTFGGGINVSGGSLAVVDSVVSGNRSQHSGQPSGLPLDGWNGLGGGIATEGGTLTLLDSTVTANTATGSQGGSRGGGLYINAGTATVSDTTIGDNRATSDAATDLGTNYGGGIEVIGADLTIERSAITGNSARGTGTPRFGFGGGLRVSGGQPGARRIAITNSTISSNEADTDGGAIALAYAAATTLNLAYATIVGNVADADANGDGNGGGIVNADGTVNVRGGIVAGNTDRGGERADCAGTIASLGDNLFGDRTHCPAAATDRDLATLDVGIGAVLDPMLADNGGPTATHALVTNSPALDAAQDGTNCPMRDQRGAARPQGQGCDIGAYEVGSLPSPSPSPTPTPSPSPTASPSSSPSPSVAPSPSPAPTYTVAATQVGGGTIAPSGTTGFPAGSVATYIASAPADRVFLGWTLDGRHVGHAARLDFTVGGDRTLVAHFAPRPAFADVPANDPDHEAITFLAAAGIVNPQGVNGSGQFQPDRDVRRAEIAALVARVFGWQGEPRANPFPDQCDPQGTRCIDDELWSAVAALADYGIVGGYADGPTCASAGTTAPCYLPRDVVQRVQVVSVVARAFTRTPGLHPAGFWDRLPADPALYTNVPESGTQRSDLTTYLANVGHIPEQASAATFADLSGNGTRRFVVRILYAAFNAQFGTDRVP